MTGNLVELKKEEDVKQTLQEALEQADEFEGVVILALTKDGGQILRSSTMSGYQKCFLFSFHQGCVMKWFRLEE